MSNFIGLVFGWSVTGYLVWNARAGILRDVRRLRRFGSFKRKVGRVGGGF